MSYTMTAMGQTYLTSYDQGHRHSVTIPAGYGAYGQSDDYVLSHAPQGPRPPGPSPNGADPAPNGGDGSPAGSVADKAKAWWSSRSSVEKGAVVVGGLATFGLLVLALTGAPKRRMRPNLSKASRAKLTKAKAGQRIRIAGDSYKVGKVVDVKGGRRFGHKIPPKRYRQKGARTASDYAWPDGYMYPLVFRTSTGKIKPQLTRKHIRSAASYYGKNKDKYPPRVRKTIHRNINRARKRFGVGDGPLAY